MPWRIEARNDEWCVIKESDGEVEGCHASRARALAQQRALYAQEASAASANGEPARVQIAAGPQRVEISSAPVDEVLVASIESISERLIASEETMGRIVVLLSQVVQDQQVDRTAFQDALTAALQPKEQEPPVVNVAVPEITVPTPIVNVSVPTPTVNVTLPTSRKKITFEHDPLTGSVSAAQIEEE